MVLNLIRTYLLLTYVLGSTIVLVLTKILSSLYQSIKKISGSVAEIISHFLTQNLKKWGQKLILGNNFINKNSDDFYILQL